MKQIVARAQASGVFVEVPEEVVAAKRHWSAFLCGS